MTRRLLLSLLVLFISANVYAACDLQITATCTNGSCTSTTTNAASTACTGEFYIGWFTDASVGKITFSNSSNTLGLQNCFNSGDFGLAAPFYFCFGTAGLGPGSSFTSNTTISGARADVPIVALTVVYDSQTFDELGSAYAFVNADVPTCTPGIAAPPLAQSGADYRVSWSAVSDPNAQFIIEESTTADFSANVTSSTVSGNVKAFHHDVTVATTYYYRVKPTQCAGSTPESSRVTQTVVQPPPPVVTDRGDAAVPLGSTTPVRFPVFIPGPTGTTALADTTFQATTDKPYLTVSPSSGTLPPGGTTVTVTANPTDLPPGANTGTLFVTTNNNSTVHIADSTTSTVPLSISLVTPVAPGSKTVPPANALVIPVVTHVNGAAGPFLSDVRLTNAASSAIKYQVSLTPTQTDATTSTKVTEITVEAAQTVALNDIVKNFFGYGATSNPSDFGFGSLEIRPLNTSSPLTYASSRTYASTVNGTFGQYIAAVPFVKFLTQREGPIPGAPPDTSFSTLSLQQIAQSVRFRTNFGLAEGAGEAANGHIFVFNDAGDLLNDSTYSLLPGEHRQMNRYLETVGITNLEDGRIEVSVDSDTGAVTAYASVLDNVTTDPLAVMPVDVSKVSATRYVLPGMADLPGENNFHSDIRVYNGGEFDIVANFTYVPQANGTPVTATGRTIRSGQVLAIDNVLPTMFGVFGTGGSIIITTSSNSSLVATGRTYTNVAGGGTYGQFIPGVTPSEGVGLGEKALQVLQLEQSDDFRSNLGLAELTGHSADLRVSLHVPDSKVTASTTLTLAPNEFRQLGRVIEGLTAPGAQTYNARIDVEVIGGSGRVTAYGSVIDNKSKDPTYVPAQ